VAALQCYGISGQRSLTRKMRSPFAATWPGDSLAEGHKSEEVPPYLVSVLVSVDLASRGRIRQLKTEQTSAEGRKTLSPGRSNNADAAVAR
jgi:hypothetical protein